MEENFVIIVPVKHAQKSRKILEVHKLWDERRRFKSVDGDKIAIPVITDDINIQILSPVVSENEVTQTKMVLPPSKKSLLKTPASILKENIKDFLISSCIEWTSEYENDLPKSWEKHGDLILFDESCFKLPVWKENEKEFWKIVSKSLNCERLGIKSVINNDGFRSPQVKLVLGDNGWVEQIDNKLRFTYDISKCMFSIGNITEKLRLAQFNCSGETVVDLYAGIGYFTIPYLVHAKAKYVHACEWNPDAVEALKKNLKLNGVEDSCTVYLGDNRKVCPVNVANRVNLGLIPSSEDGWPVACKALKKDTGGFLHIHANINSMCQDSSYSSHHLPIDNCDKSKTVLNDSEQGKKSRGAIWNKWADETSRRIHTLLYEYHNTEWTVNTHHIEHVKSYAPHIDHLVLDLECRPKS